MKELVHDPTRHVLHTLATRRRLPPIGATVSAEEIVHRLRTVAARLDLQALDPRRYDAEVDRILAENRRCERPSLSSLDRTMIQHNSGAGGR